jgi:tetratricopeptide (TPR) repeat protein
LHGKIGQQPGEECIPSDCLQVGGTPADSCKWLELCRALDSDVQIKAKRAEIKNLGLIAAIATYTRVLKSLQQLQQDPAARVKAVVAALVSAPMRDLAMEKMFVENSMLLLQDDLRLAVADRKLETGGESEGAASDGVTNVVQSLPRRPRLITPEYRDLADRLIQYYDQPRVAMMDAARFVESVNPEFALLASRVPEGNGELELLRCLLHLAYPLRSGDARVVNSTDENCRKYPDQQAEFLYVGCWAARRMKRYAESILFADRGVALNRQDPRFYHGRALSIYCWIASGTAGCSKVMQDAIDDTVRAIELFELDPEAGRDREMLSACYNNAAYFSLVPDLSAPDGPSKASEFFDKLLQVLPRSQWTPKYPEYYHTESLLLYSRYLVQKQGGAKEGTARPHLVRAMGQLRTAVQLDPCQEYKELYDTMQRALGAPAKARSTP